MKSIITLFDKVNTQHCAHFDDKNVVQNNTLNIKSPEKFNKTHIFRKSTREFMVSINPDDSFNRELNKERVFTATSQYETSRDLKLQTESESDETESPMKQFQSTKNIRIEVPKQNKFKIKVISKEPQTGNIQLEKIRSRNKPPTLTNSTKNLIPLPPIIPSSSESPNHLSPMHKIKTTSTAESTNLVHKQTKLKFYKKILRQNNSQNKLSLNPKSSLIENFKNRIASNVDSRRSTSSNNLTPFYSDFYQSLKDANSDITKSKSRSNSSLSNRSRHDGKHAKNIAENRSNYTPKARNHGYSPDGKSSRILTTTTFNSNLSKFKQPNETLNGNPNMLGHTVTATNYSKFKIMKKRK